MQPKIFLILVMSGFLLLAAGCTPKAKKARVTGFLTDYSKLSRQEWDRGSLKYIDMKRLAGYQKFIIEPVKVRQHWKRRDHKQSSSSVTSLADYMHRAVISEVGGRYLIVSEPGPGVARMRIALTDIDDSQAALYAIPFGRLSGGGVGGASMEAELLDSQTGEQIAAVIESQKGKRVSLEGLEAWGSARSVMDDWAKRIRVRLDEAHGYERH